MEYFFLVLIGVSVVLLYLFVRNKERRMDIACLGMIIALLAWFLIPMSDRVLLASEARAVAIFTGLFWLCVAIALLALPRT